MIVSKNSLFLKRMTIPILIFMIFFGMHIKTVAQIPKVLFIGNSYTDVNDLPQLFHDLALSGGDTIAVYKNTPGGYTFQLHTSNTATLAMIDSMPWDFVVLQEQSQLPSFPPAQVATQSLPYAQQLDSLIHLNDSCTLTAFFMTWGRKYGDASNCVNYPPVCTFQGMQQRLKESYLLMGDGNEALVAPVGEAWKASWLADSTIDLWMGDFSHPNPAGSYLAACVFYATLLQKNPSGLPFTSTLNTATAGFLQTVAWQTVSDSMSLWNINEFLPQAGFSFNINGATVDFQNMSVNCNYYLWDFGDGNFSTAASPTHTYSAPGTYNVTLIGNRYCESDTMIIPVTVTATSMNEYAHNMYWKISGGSLMVHSDRDYTVNISDALGRCIVHSNIEKGENEVDLSNIGTGIRFLTFVSNHTSQTYKIALID